VSFWILQAKGKRPYSLIFIGIFRINSTISTYGFFSNYSTLYSLQGDTGNRIAHDLARLLVSGNKKKMSAVSHIIIQKYGIALPFMTHDDLFSLHAPTKADKDILLDDNEKR